MSAVQTVAVAPSHPGGQGSRKVGGHIAAFRAQPKFALDASLKLVSGVNPWRPNTPGHDFYVAVLSHNPKSVGAAIDLGKKAGLNAGEVQGHLRWLYTWGGAHIEIGGKLYAPPASAPSVPAVVQSAKAPAKSKVKA